jgi:hypothetical protein
MSYSSSPSDICSWARCAAAALVARRLATWLHELAHLWTAHLLGYAADISMSPRPSVSVAVSGLKPAHDTAIRHAGWMASVLLAAALVAYCLIFSEEGGALATMEAAGAFDGRLAGALESRLAAAAFVLVAMEGVYSDLISTASRGRYHCGNFGMLLLSPAGAKRVDRFLRHMLKITMMRGAQSAGLVTYLATKGGAVGVRHRAGTHRGGTTYLGGGVRCADRSHDHLCPRRIVLPMLLIALSSFPTMTVRTLSKLSRPQTQTAPAPSTDCPSQLKATPQRTPAPMAPCHYLRVTTALCSEWEAHRSL